MIRSLALLFLVAKPLWALECSNDQFEDIPFSICSANVEKDDLRIFLRNDKNDIFGRFQTLDVYLRGQGPTLDFARNGGCLLYTSPSPRDGATSRMPSSA